MTKTSNSARMEKLRKVRSFNDVLAILKDIAKEVIAGKEAVSELKTSLSAGTNPVTEITIDHTGSARPTTPRKVTVGPKVPNPGSLTGLKLTKFVAPPIAVVRKHYSVISALHDNANELEAIEALITQAFASAKNQKQTLVAIKALRKEVESSLQKAFTALDSIAQKHLPTEMENLGDALVSYIIDSLNPRSYDNLEKEVYVALDEAKNIVFSMYISLKGLKNRTGFVFDEYYIILTGVINNKSVIHYYLNAIPEFKVPGKYPPPSPSTPPPPRPAF